MEKFKRRKLRQKQLYNNGDVWGGFWYWRQKLLNYCLSIFEWEGCPESLPGREIEMNLLLTGHAVIIESKDGLVCPVTDLYGFDVYYRPTHATYGNPLLPFKRIELGKNGAVIYNDRIAGNILTDQVVDSGLRTFIDRYARALADIESSISAYVINTRTRTHFVAADQVAYEKLEDYQRRIELGERAVMMDDNELESIRTLDPGPALPDDLNSLLIARDKMLSCFFRDIGVKFLESQKRAQMTEDEVQADEQMLLINIDDLREEREAGADRVNALFGVHLRPKINPAFDRSRQRKEIDEPAGKEDKDDNTGID